MIRLMAHPSKSSKKPKKRIVRDTRKQAGKALSSQKETVEKEIPIAHAPRDLNKKHHASTIAFRQHPVLLVLRLGLAGIVFALFWWFLALLDGFFAAQANLLLHLFWALLFAATLFYLSFQWEINTVFIRKGKILRISQRGLFQHAVVSLSFRHIRYTDLRQKGLLHLLFDYGNVHVTSIISDEIRDIVFYHVWDAKDLFHYIEAHISQPT